VKDERVCECCGLSCDECGCDCCQECRCYTHVTGPGVDPRPSIQPTSGKLVFSEVRITPVRYRRPSGVAQRRPRWRRMFGKRS
jgi:hypothetical protein